MQHERDHARTTDSQWNKGAPAVPRILHASPGDRDQKACRGCEEKRHTDPIDFLELAEEGAVLDVKLKEEGDKNGANAEERKVDPKDPTPADILGKATT